MQVPSPPRRHRKRPHRYLVFLRHIFSFALASGAGGFFVGVLMGLDSYLNPSPYTVVGSAGAIFGLGDFIFIAVANAIWMSVLGVFVALVVFLCVELASSKWSPHRKVRFARSLKMRLYFPLAATIAFVTLLAMGGWALWHQSLASNLGSVAQLTSLSMLPLGACLWAVLLARSTRRTANKGSILTERLLPLD